MSITQNNKTFYFYSLKDLGCGGRPCERLRRDSISRKGTDEHIIELKDESTCQLPFQLTVSTVRSVRRHRSDSDPKNV